MLSKPRILSLFHNSFNKFNKHEHSCKILYEGCSNMNASSFITFVTYMLRQNGIRFHKGLYVTFYLAPDLKHIILIELSPFE